MGKKDYSDREATRFSHIDRLVPTASSGAMEEKRPVDAFGAACLIGFASLLAFNQVVIKVTGQGFNPVFQAGLRSALGLIVLLIWMRAFSIPLAMPRQAVFWGVVSGLLFTYEFVLLFVALDLTSVSRASILFYTMPVWLGIAAHFILPGEQLTRARAMGMALAVGGIVVALADRSGNDKSLVGDLCALAATIGWAAINLVVRVTPLSAVPPQNQLLYQLVVSAIVMLAISPLFGSLIRDPGWLHISGLMFQSICVVSLGFMLWFWLLTRYKASGVAAFSFLSPVLAVFLSWGLLGEALSAQVWVALGLVAAGIYLVNRQ